MNKYEQLFEEFKRLPKLSVSSPTYIEIAGYPHYENVCSNILGFFFDTKQNHKFEELVLKSFLDCVDESIANKFNLETKTIYREYRIDDNKRIDLVIECDEIIITIENKIFHWLANDLKLYEKSINKNFDKKEKKVFVVLSLKEENINSSSFVNLTYETFFKRLKQNLGFYFVNANNQYTTFLLDLIKSIENLTRMETINKDFFDFFIKNKETINDINIENNKLYASLHNVVRKVMNLLPQSEENRKMWLYQKVDIVNDFTFDDGVVSLDVVFDLDTVKASLWLRKNNSSKGKFEILDQLQIVKEPLYSYEKTINGYILFKEQIDFVEINTDEFANKIETILKKIKY